MFEYSEAFKEFEDSVSETRMIEGAKVVIVETVQDYYDEDETMCEEEWSNFLDGKGLSLIVSVEDCISNEYLGDKLEQQCLDSYVNGNFTQFSEQFHDLYADEFLDWLSETWDKDLYIEVMRRILGELI